MAADVEIVGGGIAGLSSAIFCARAGLDVVVHEQAARIGGAMPPAIYCTSYIDIERLEEQLGLPLQDSFRPADVEVWFKGSTYRAPSTRMRMYNVIRGNHPASFDRCLERIARTEGVAIKTRSPIPSLSRLKADKRIIATGWHKGLLQACDVSTTDGHGVLVHAVKTSDKDVCIAIIDKSISPDWYAHVGITRELSYFITGSAGPFSKKDADALKRALVKKGIIPETAVVSTFSGAQVTRPRLFLDADTLLAGAASGATSPLAFHGLAEALVSGWIAGIGVQDPSQGQALYNSTFKNRFYKDSLLSRLRVLPFHDLLTQAVIRTTGLHPWFTFDYPDLA